MRRGLAVLVLGLSLVLASVAWAGFVLSNTVLDPGRSERLADQMLDNEVLRAALVSRIAAAMGAALPPEVPVPDQQLEQAADLALDDPRVDALVRDGIVRVHRNALEGTAEPVTLDASALGAATRDALIGIRPELTVVLPEAPPLTVELPTTGLSWLGRLRRLAQRVTFVLGLVSVAGILASTLLAKNRPAVMRRVSLWAFGAASFWLIVGHGIPFLARSVAPSSTAVVSAMTDVFFGAIIRPAMLMGVFGLVLFGLSFVWAFVNRRLGARILQPSSPRGGGRPGQPPVGPAYRTPAVAAFEPPAPTGAVGQGPSHRADATQVYPVLSAPPTAPATTTSGPRPTPTWVEGVGYVEDGAPDAPDS